MRIQYIYIYAYIIKERGKKYNSIKLIIINLINNYLFFLLFLFSFIMSGKKRIIILA